MPKKKQTEESNQNKQRIPGVVKVTNPKQTEQF